MIASTNIIGPFQKPWFRVGILLVAILLSSSLGRTLWFSYQTQKAISQQEAQVRQLEHKVDQLEADLRVATSSFTLEKRVRDELQYQKPQEQIFRLDK